MASCELVGILNLTPDSYSDDGVYNNAEEAVTKAAHLFEAGASIVDIGAESTKRGATPLSHQEEWARLEPVLNTLLSDCSNHVSIDTYHPENVLKAARIGSFIINDVTGFNDPKMIEAAAELGFRCIVSHLPQEFGQDIQTAHQARKVDSVQQVYEELMNKCDDMMASGIDKENIIIDPGLGFGKTTETNWKLLAFAALVPDYPTMVGYSDKGFLGADNLTLERNLEAAEIAIKAGAKYLRVHDVAGHYNFIKQYRSDN